MVPLTKLFLCGPVLALCDRHHTSLRLLLDMCFAAGGWKRACNGLAVPNGSCWIPLHAAAAVHHTLAAPDCHALCQGDLNLQRTIDQNHNMVQQHSSAIDWIGC